MEQAADVELQMKVVTCQKNNYMFRAVMESNHYKAHQCQLKSPWPEEIPGGNTNRCVSSLSKDEALRVRQ